MIIRIIRRLKAWRVYVGRHPYRVPAPAIILLPVFNGVFFCGFAGVVAIRSSKPEGGEPRACGRDLAEQLARTADERMRNGIAAVLGGRISPEGYLAPEREDGRPDREGPADMESLVRRLKETIPFQALFFDNGRFRSLEALAGRLKAFLAGEERLLEEAAGHFSTGELEIVNGRLVALKDAAWALEKDILENIGRIAALSGSDRELN
ncbi:MAG TPA: hypothetical protein PLX98_11980, partial [Candidatus Aminicenantes bacterium]|nr:hypothetical protein [Candidatus Aminicenantes bacterium]